MDDCLFCRIIDRKIPAKIVYEDERAVAIEDINPHAPTHLLVIPRRHLPSLLESKAEDEALLGHLFLVAGQLAHERGLDPKGYRTVINTGAGAGQTVFHLHVHLLGGRAFHWPPG
jgi:histidine triad (HIT) family protein